MLLTACNKDTASQTINYNNNDDDDDDDNDDDDDDNNNVFFYPFFFLFPSYSFAGTQRLEKEINLNGWEQKRLPRPGEQQ